MQKIEKLEIIICPICHRVHPYAVTQLPTNEIVITKMVQIWKQIGFHLEKSIILQILYFLSQGKLYDVKTFFSV